MFKIFTISILLTIITFAEAPLLKTGQTTVYADYDDGYYQKGAAREYDNTSKPGIVIDKVTLLEWQDDYSDNSDDIKEADWQGAIDYCSGLGLDGGEWRLPTRKELVTLSDYGRVGPAIDPKFTQQVTSSNYWSSTPYAGNTSSAWLVNFDYGYQFNYDKSYSPYVRCVRSGQ